MSVYQYALKIDKDLMQEIRILSEKENRSVNKQIEHMLKQYLLVIQPKIDTALSEIQNKE